MELSDILTYLEDPETYWDGGTQGDIELPWEVKAEDYREFAERDLLSNEHHRLINALANAKRALACQVDSVLFALGLFPLSQKKHWNFPEKIKILQNLGVIAPRILLKITRARNLMEHEYVVPAESEVEDFLDVVSLFIASTQSLIYARYEEADFVNSDIDEVSFLHVCLNSQKEMMEFCVYYLDKTKAELCVQAHEHFYLDLLRVLLDTFSSAPR
ncbi:MAG TPA: hypothetical protein PKD09_15355 [Aggregatilinea sp.]|uniref:hypothetical protein n=1 Tax=Aggregatilinea sp. TaxID=2806333 RepID=UPI002BD6210D|nr:hypothetical protein [Aggregatilinea sp.]HML23029.1 hypothetical protein [Aggregatilinea sp.]